MTGIAPEWRRAIYCVVAVALTALGVYGIVDESQASTWLPIAGMVLGVAPMTMAAANTPRKPEPPSIVEQIGDRVRDGLDSWGRG